MDKAKKAALFSGAALFLAAFVTYVKTLSPSVSFGDSGELISVAYVLGMPHPTGFPLYILASKIATLLPLGDVAFRVNLLSAFFGALTVTALFYFFLLSLKNEQDSGFKYFISLSAAIIFIFSFTVWSQAVMARVYTMNAFFCALMLILFVYYTAVNKSDKILYLMSFLTGVGTGLHLTFVILCAVLWGHLLITGWKEIKGKLAFAARMFLIGITVYLYLIIRGYSSAAIVWEPLASLKDFIPYITQKQYKRKMLGLDGYRYLLFFKYVWEVLVREFTPLGLAVFGAGVALAIKQKLKYIIAFGVIFLANVLLLSVYGDYTDLKLAFRYFIPAYLIAAYFIMYFLFYLPSLLPEKLKKTGVYVSCALALALIPLNYASHRAAVDKSNNYLAYYFPQDILNSAATAAQPDGSQKAYLFSNGDNQIYTMAYFKFVKKLFKNVTVLDTTPTIFKDMLLLEGAIKELRKNDKNPSPISMTDYVYEADNQKLYPQYTTTSFGLSSFREPFSGLLNRVTTGSEPDAFYQWKTYSLRGILYDRVYNEFEQREVVGSYFYKYAVYYINQGRRDLADYLLNESAATAFDNVPVLGNLAIIYTQNKDFIKAEELLKKCISMDPKNHAIYYNLGSVYANQNRFIEAAANYRKAAELFPANFAYLVTLQRANAAAAEMERKNTQMPATGNIPDAMRLINQKKYAEALKLLMVEYNTQPDSAPLNYYIALCNSFLGNLQDAVPYYEKAIKLQPDKVVVLVNAGLCYLKINERAKARKVLERAVELEPSNAKAARLLRQAK